MDRALAAIGPLNYLIYALVFGIMTGVSMLNCIVTSMVGSLSIASGRWKNKSVVKYQSLTRDI